MARPNYRELATKLRTDGGFTVHNVKGDVPTKGYAVALKGFEMTVCGDLAHTYRRQVADMIKLYADLFRDELASANRYLGGWVSDGVVYLDISEVVQTREAAEVLAQERQQLAYYCLHDGVEIVTGGPDELREAREVLRG